MLGITIAYNLGLGLANGVGYPSKIIMVKTPYKSFLNLDYLSQKRQQYELKHHRKAIGYSEESQRQ
jgi:hypothetical protein